MADSSLNVPVLLVTFNRPENAQKIFNAIKQVRPKKLYLFSDAPRKGNEADAVNVSKCRSLLDQVDWPCDVKTKFETVNLGCGPGPMSAISWMFQNEEKGIILEDDCLPDTSFFSYCEYMLDKYEQQPRVMHIAGTRWNDEYKVDENDHFFSTIGHIWGWATWKRAWQLYDYEMKSWNKKKGRQLIKSRLQNRLLTEFWVDSFEYTYRNNPTLRHAWDYQWQYTLFQHNGLSVVPNVNLVSNIGVQGVHSSENDLDKTSFHRRT
ncbi:MAG: hypothetical protein M3Q06_13385, partial [Bacteroidota bacterium]|nr:hypothetical protein [Bacteroidota bacterium]